MKTVIAIKQFQRLSNKWDVVAELIKQRQEKLNKSLEESQNLQHKYDQFVERMLIFTNTNDNHCDVITSSRPNDDIIRVRIVENFKISELI